jgi:DNA helicase-2/ATP-dependent DNA helicase PcrA
VFIVAVEQGLVPHERSRETNELVEEERRLLFVGITRAREELQLGMATYREFRGLRRRTVPSQFLMELPRGEMNVVEPAWTAPPDWETSDGGDEAAWDFGDPEAVDDLAPSERSAPRATAPLMTAAELSNAATAEVRRTAPEAFHLDMIVRHPEYGLGKVIALSGTGIKRTATVAFASTAGEKKFRLAQSDLVPVRSK